MTYPADDDLSAVCPYLGLADDADSHATYATEAHRCYRLEQPTRIASGHQESYCLGSNHVTCPVYRGEGIAATSRSAAAAGAATAGAAAASRAPRGRAPRESRGAAGGRGGNAAADGTRRSPALERKRPTGTLGPRPRSGGISMPTATIALFALAAVVLVLAFVINRAVGDNGEEGLSAADKFATQQAQTRTPTQAAGGAQTPAGNDTPATTRTAPAGGGTATAATPTPSGGNGSGAATYEVQPGDNCSSISRQTGVSVDDIIRLNPALNSSCSNLLTSPETSTIKLR